LPGSFDGETVTRRRLMSATAGVAGAAAGAAIVLPALGFAIGPVARRQPVTWQAIGPPNALPTSTFVRRVIQTAPDLGSLGRLTIFVRRRDPRLDTEPADRWNQFIAVTSHCSHVGCPVGFYPAASSFVCPCHGGVYDLRGLRTGGPPPRPSTASSPGSGEDCSRSAPATASTAACAATTPATPASRSTASGTTSTHRA
jgi:Rieske Fe-S protein